MQPYYACYQGSNFRINHCPFPSVNVRQRSRKTTIWSQLKQNSNVVKVNSALSLLHVKYTHKLNWISIYYLCCFILRVIYTVVYRELKSWHHFLSSFCTIYCLAFRLLSIFSDRSASLQQLLKVEIFVIVTKLNIHNFVSTEKST